MNQLLEGRFSFAAAVALFLLAGSCLFTGCSERSDSPAPLSPSPFAPEEDAAAGGANQWKPALTHDYSADVARAWFDRSYDLVRTERWSPPVASRFWGYAGIALYEAVRPGMPRYETLAHQIHGFDSVPAAEGPAYHWPTVANAALHVVFAQFFEAATPATRDAIETQYDDFAAAFEAGLPPGIFRRSEDFGVAIGESILDLAAADGYDIYAGCSYTPPSGPGMWVPTPPAYAPPLQPCWGQLRTCVVSGGAACDPGLPPAYSETPGTEFYGEGDEVYQTSLHLTPEQREIAIFWSDAPGETGTPPGHWIRLLGQLLGERHATLARAAEAYAGVGIAEMDAFICCWLTKYQVNLIRPVSYIQAVIDPSWSPLLTTPPFPEYPSGHSSQSGAVAEVLTRILGEFPYTDHTHDTRGLPARSFTSFQQAADEAAISRLYGGIHYRAAIENGLEQGRCIGKSVNSLVFRRPPV